MPLLSGQGLGGLLSIPAVVAPSFAIASAATDGLGGIINMVFSKNLDTSSTPAVGDFSISGGRTIGSVTVFENTVRLSGITAVYTDADTITVTYTPGTNQITSVDAEQAPAFSSQAVTNNVGVLLAGAAFSDQSASTITFTLNEAAKLSLGAVCARSNAGSNVVYTLTDTSDSSTAFTQTLAFSVANYENLASTSEQVNAENNVEVTSLAAGTYEYTVSGAASPIGSIVRRADAYTGFCMQNGSNFHSGPYVLKDAGVEYHIGSQLGVNTRYIRDITNDGSPIEVLSESLLDTQERYHSSSALVKVNGYYYAIATDHNAQIYGKGSTTIAGLAGTSTRLGDTGTEYTYLKAAADSSTNRVLALARAGNNGGMHLLVIDPSDSTHSVIHVTPTGNRRYPVDLQEVRSGVFAIVWQNRASEAWVSLHCALYDRSTDDWFNAAGKRINSGSGASSGSPILSAFGSDTDYISGGARLIARPSTSDSLYTPGPPAIQVTQWNLLYKSIQVGAVYGTWASTSATAKTTTTIGLLVCNESTRLTAENDPLSVEPTNGYRGPALAFWDGANLAVAYGDRDQRDREYYYSTDTTNLYYDMTGSKLRIVRVETALEQATDTALSTAATLQEELTPTLLNSGSDPKGEALQVFNFERDGRTAGFFTQIGLNSLDVTQSQGTVKAYSFDGSNASWRSQGKTLPPDFSVFDGYRFNLTQEQVNTPNNYVPGVWVYNSGTWTFDGTPGSETTKNGIANFNGTDQYIRASTNFIPDLSVPMKIRCTVNAASSSGSNRILSWGSTTNASTIIDVGVNDSEEVRVFWRNDADGELLRVSSTGVVLDGTDHEIEIDYDGVDSIDINIDGILDSRHTFGVAIGTFSIDSFVIGALGRSGIGNYFSGIIKNIEIELNGTLQHRWRLNEAINDIVIDEISRNDGKVQNLDGSFWTTS